jgi:AraC-like DNA-binding protein
MIALKNMLDNLDISIHNIELYTVGKEWNYRKVNNPYSRIYLVTEGYGQIFHDGQEFLLKPGCLHLIPCYTTVNMCCPETFTHYYVHFNARIPTGIDILSIFRCNYQVDTAHRGIGREVFERLLELNPDKELTEYDARKPIYRQVLDRAAAIDSQKSPSDVLESNALMRLILAAFFRDYDHPQTLNTLHGMARFEKVLAYIAEHLDRPLCLRGLAELANLSPTYFSNLFSQLMGVSPIQYINKRRIEESQKLLLGTDHTLYTIARTVGFADEYYFSRLFKKIVGVSPDGYRKQNLTLHQRRSETK